MTAEREKGRLPSRRDFISLGIGAFVVGSVPLALRGKGPRLVRRTLPVMGTLGEVAIVHGDPRYAQGAIDAAFQELRRVESVLTRYRPDSEIGRLNRLAGAGPQPVSRETAEVLAASLRWAEGSEGGFDPCLGRAVGLWDVSHRHRPPGLGEFQRYAGRTLFRSLELGRSGGRDVVLFHDEDLGIDLGGIGKGYGVDRAVSVLRDWGIEDAVVNLGGDLYAMGASEDGDAWSVGVQSPDDAQSLVTTLSMRDQGVATSGDYRRYFQHGGRRYHHILDPETGAPSETRTRSVTVAAESCLTADAAATAAFVSSPSGAPELLRRMAPGAEVVHSI